MNSIDKALKNIMGKRKSNFGFGSIKPINPLKNFNLKPFGGKNDLDFDGVPNRRDCQPRNTMRQDGTNSQNILVPITRNNVNDLVKVWGRRKLRDNKDTEFDIDAQLAAEEKQYNKDADNAEEVRDDEV